MSNGTQGINDVAASKLTTESVSHALSTCDAESKTEHEHGSTRAIDRDIPNGDSGTNHDTEAKPLQHVTSVGRQGPSGSMQSRTRPPALSKVEFGDCAKADGIRSSLDTITPHSLTSALSPESHRSDGVPDRMDVAPEENPRNGMSNGLKKLRHTLSKRVKGGQQVKVHKLNEMGEIVDKKGHRAWDMACALQLGIRVNVGMNSQASYSKVPDFETFQEHVKLKFPSKGSSTTPPHSGASFQFKDYAPTIFRHLRDAFSIDTADYMVALCNTSPDGSNSLRIMGTPGKSGSLFFFSNDMRFIVKTLPKREAALLREILPAYYQHVKQNPGTYLPRFYGLHRWKPEFGSNVRFVVMNNVFATSLALHTRFDLKGSTLGRTASANERRKGPRAILKDLDLIESGTASAWAAGPTAQTARPRQALHVRFDIKGSTLGRTASANERKKGLRAIYKDLDMVAMQTKLRMGPDRKRAFLKQIRSDCHLLMGLKIMD
eukprot:CAMPEP_0172181512 /NCGR_PEP_ID=MMETSP1050-20130122/17860_1 /TAXON_ID=233186 /ORGANISM="Cryptomonas curvata, Strain CCAP979/52" /LENGTH=489 /DNA_ID=CAMNT_0012854805 /DNA_START=195 /DNA_END=1662 /DNA_ORIENTATION=-